MKWNAILRSLSLFIISCNNNKATPEEKLKADSTEKAQTKVVTGQEALPAPYATESAKKTAR